MTPENATGQAGPRVLIVDDNAIIRTLLRSILRSSRYQIVGEASNGVNAVELARRLKPDIICMDLIMPQMGGLEALQTIKAMRPEMVIVMITGTPSVDNVQKSIQMGANGFIVKPFNAGKVLDTLSQTWQSARQASAGKETKREAV